MPFFRTMRRRATISMDSPHVRRSILGSLVRQSIFVSAVTIVVLSALSFIVTRSVTTQQRLFDKLSSLATERKASIEEVTYDTRQKTSLLAQTLRRKTLSELDLKTLDRALGTLDNSLARAEGIAVFDLNRKLVRSSGDRVPAFFWTFEGTLILPYFDSKKGWESVTAYTPLHDLNGKRIGTLAVQFNVEPLLRKIFSDLSESVGKSAEVILVRDQGGQLFIIHHSQKDQRLLSYALGDLTDEYIEGSPLALSATGHEGVAETKDDRGRSVLVAYRYIQSMGWGLAVQVQSSEAFAGISLLGFSLTIISVLVLALAGIVGFVFARRLTEPLLHLVVKIQVLRPGHWLFRRSVSTGDEVELLDQVIADLASRLQTSYEQLEGQVVERTAALNKEMTLDRAILESIEYGVITTDSTGKITDSNSAASRLLGFRKQELMGKGATDALKLQYQKGPFTSELHPVSVCLRERSIFRAPPTMHLCMAKKDGTLLPVMLMVTPLLQDSTLLGSIAIFLDVTEERQTDYMKSEFISLASHQLRTPLSSLRWYLELIMSDEKAAFSEDQKSYLDEIQKASSEMAHLLDTLLRVARLDDGGMLIEKKSVDVVELLDHVFNEMKQSNKTAQCSFRSILPSHPVVLSTDTVLLPIVMQNLIVNALKYSPNGGEIFMEVAEESDKILVHLHDQGMGIPKEEQPNVFQKFFRSKASRQMLTSGTGLGLYLSKRIMESIGGNLSFRSEEGKGTTFTAVLPKE